MGKLQKIFYLLFTLSFVPTLQAQDSLYFFQYPGQRYLTMRDITHTKMGDTTDFQRYIDLGEVVQQQYVNGKQYYYHPFFSAPILQFLQGVHSQARSLDLPSQHLPSLKQ